MYTNYLVCDAHSFTGTLTWQADVDGVKTMCVVEADVLYCQEFVPVQNEHLPPANGGG